MRFKLRASEGLVLFAFLLTACAPASTTPEPEIPTLAPLFTPLPTSTATSIYSPTPPIAISTLPSPTPAGTPTPVIAVVPTPTVVPPVAEIIFVPSGRFMMGSPAGSDRFAEQWERPAHEVTLNAFWMTQTEVTNAQYALCVQDSACVPVQEAASRTRGDYYTNPAYMNFPVVNITQPQAQDFCGWVGGRLPTEAEWEYAARYNDSRLYPWGDEMEINRGSFGRPEGNDTEPVFSYPNGASALGFLNLSGNVWEWIADWYDPNYYEDSPARNPQGPETGRERVVRGGAYGTDPQFVRAANRRGLNPDTGYDNVGFRCAFDAPPAGAILLPTLTPAPSLTPTP